jgi:transcription antitermination factor NusG
MKIHGSDFHVNQEVRVKRGRFEGRTGQITEINDETYTVTVYIGGVYMDFRQNEVATICH